MTRRPSTTSSAVLLALLMLPGCQGQTVQHPVSGAVKPNANVQPQRQTTPANASSKNMKTILGSSKAEVDAMLDGWTSRADKLSTPRVKVTRYTRGVTLI